MSLMDDLMAGFKRAKGLSEAIIPEHAVSRVEILQDVADALPEYPENVPLRRIIQQAVRLTKQIRRLSGEAYEILEKLENEGENNLTDESFDFLRDILDLALNPLMDESEVEKLADMANEFNPRG